MIETDAAWRKVAIGTRFLIRFYLRAEIIYVTGELNQANTRMSVLTREVHSEASEVAASRRIVDESRELANFANKCIDEIIKFSVGKEKHR